MTKDDDIFVAAITGATDSYRQGAGLPKLDQVCPVCGVKYKGYCFNCRKAVDLADERERYSYPGYLRRRDGDK